MELPSVMFQFLIISASQYGLAYNNGQEITITNKYTNKMLIYMCM